MVSRIYPHRINRRCASVDLRGRGGRVCVMRWCYCGQVSGHCGCCYSHLLCSYLNSPTAHTVFAPLSNFDMKRDLRWPPPCSFALSSVGLVAVVAPGLTAVDACASFSLPCLRKICTTTLAQSLLWWHTTCHEHMSHFCTRRIITNLTHLRRQLPVLRRQSQPGAYVTR